MGEAIRRAHEICDEDKQEYIEAVEVINRAMAADVAVYRINHSKGT
jgi:hypothetical protein